MEALANRNQKPQRRTTIDSMLSNDYAEDIFLITTIEELDAFEILSKSETEFRFRKMRFLYKIELRNNQIADLQ